ncbi:hypothetical protein [Paraburkholderia bonniea]|uniref:hypothetical protein n=1 Tax=Paraburkholderia bonniea TaxID=2152891 RepID=UPI0012929B0C|nr:hypothetical protein [Paraburkholderia bonniea]
MLKKIFYSVACTYLVAILVLGSLEVIFYKIPEENQLSVSVGKARLAGSRGGDNFFLKTQNGKKVFACQNTSMNWLQNGICPFSSKVDDAIKNSIVEVGWHQQEKSILTSSGKQIYFIKKDGEYLVDYQKMRGFYKNNNNHSSAIQFIIFEVAICIILMLRIFKNKSAK